MRESLNNDRHQSEGNVGNRFNIFHLLPPKLVVKLGGDELGRLVVNEIMSKVVDSFNFSGLQDIINGYAERSAGGKRRDKTSILSRSRIFTVEGSSALESTGVCAPLLGVILLYEKEIKSFALDHDISTEGETLRTFVHEQIHVAGKNPGSSEILLNLLKQAPSFQLSGYGRAQRAVGGSHSLLFEAFNEGVVEKLSLEIVKEYLKRFGCENYSLAKEESSQSRGLYSYRDNVAIVDAITEAVGSHIGVPSEVVWNAIVRGYFRGMDLLDRDIVRGLSEVLTDDFIKALREGYLAGYRKDAIRRV